MLTALLLLVLLSSAKSAYLDPGVKEVVESLHASLGYLRDNHESVNVDGAAGARMAHSIFAGLLKHLTDTGPFMKSLLLSLRDDTASLADLLEEDSQRRNPKYYDDVGPFISSELWEGFYANTRFLGPLQKNISNEKVSSAADETMCDYCLKEVLKHKNLTGGCELSEVCLKYMTTGLTIRYYATHQIIYLMAGLLVRCWNWTSHLPNVALDEFLNENNTKVNHRYVGDVIQYICNNIFEEAKELYHFEISIRSHLNQGYRDLFMEQGVVCGLVGYSEFFSDMWGRRVLSWQDPHSGCFPQHSESQAQDRRDVTMPGDCSAHGTSLLLAHQSLQLKEKLEHLYPALPEDTI